MKKLPRGSSALQINCGSANGARAWRDVVVFESARRHEVEDAAASLSRAAGGMHLRIVDAAGAVRHMNEFGAFREARP